MTKEKGAEGFSSDYWSENYSEPEEMDGIGNASLHADYAKSFFDLEHVDISSIIDFGFGLAHLLKAFCQKFMPYKIHGIEPSDWAYEKLSKEELMFSPSSKVKLKNIDLMSWAQSSKENSKRFDLGICTSVFQYLDEEEIAFVLSIMAKRVRYLYFSVPTDLELKRQVGELNFCDRYAIARSKEKYRQLISPHFAIIGARILESKFFYDDSDTVFSDLLFRD